MSKEKLLLAIRKYAAAICDIIEEEMKDKPKSRAHPDWERYCSTQRDEIL